MQKLNSNETFESTAQCIMTSDDASTRNRELKISQLFLVSKLENFNRISDSENDSFEFICLPLKF